MSRSNASLYWRPQRLFRDCSAWYHIVLACDSTLATQTDRVKIYVNGVRETSFHNNSGPSQNYDFGLNTTSNTRYIGTKVSTSSYYDGYLAEYYQIDGQQLQASDFGEFDEDSGIWKPKIYEGTFGDAGSDHLCLHDLIGVLDLCLFHDLFVNQKMLKYLDCLVYLSFLPILEPI